MRDAVFDPAFFLFCSWKSRESIIVDYHWFVEVRDIPESQTIGVSLISYHTDLPLLALRLHESFNTRNLEKLQNSIL